MRDYVRHSTSLQQVSLSCCSADHRTREASVREAERERERKEKTDRGGRAQKTLAFLIKVGVVTTK